MCCLRPGRPRLGQLPRASKQVWKKLTKSTKSLHKLLSFRRKSDKLPVTKNPKPTYTKVYPHSQRRSKKQLLSFLFPRQSHLKKRQNRQKYYLATRQPPIFIDDLFHASARPMAITTTFLAPSSLSMLKMPIDNEGQDHEEGATIEGNNSIELTSPSMGIDERAEIFIASFRAELDRSFRKW